MAVQRGAVFFWRCGISAALALFFSLASWSRLSADLAAGYHASLAVRSALICLGGLLLGWRGGGLLAKQRACRPAILFLICCCGFIFYPVTSIHPL